MAAITYDKITRVSAVKVSSDDNRLYLADFFIEDSLATADTISAEALGVSRIRGVLGITSVDAGDWVTQAASAVTLNAELRARAASYAAGSSEPAAASANDADQLVLGAALNAHEAMWIQLLVEN